MPRTVVAGRDGSPESLAAADWAAREALRQGLPLRPGPRLDVGARPACHHAPPAGPDPQRHRAERIPREATTELRRRYPDLPVAAVQASEQPFHGAELDYVSCSPLRTPVARLEAGRASSHGHDLSPKGPDTAPDRRLSLS